MTHGYITLTPTEVAALRRLRHSVVTRVLDDFGSTAGNTEIPVDAIPSGSVRSFTAAVARVRRTVGTRGDDAASLWSYLKQNLISTRKNAIRRGIAFDLTVADVQRLFDRSGGRCQVSAVAFSLNKFETNRAPFAPSIDRVNCLHGYVPGNVRLTCQIANLAMNVWGEEVLATFIRQSKLQPNFQENFRELIKN